jgi:hypothetical protein
MKLKSLILATIAALALNVTQAAEVAGVRFDDKTKIGNNDLLANGAGLRKKAFFKVYAMALYLTEKQGEPEGVLTAKGAKRISISLLRDLSAQQFVDALQEGVANNHSETEMGALKDRLKQFSDAMLSIDEAKTGTTVLIDWLPESGTRLTVNGQIKGKDIAGDDFYKALLKIWIGKQPVQDNLKAALLGKDA